jgi:hypothetical protein
MSIVKCPYAHFNKNISAVFIAKHSCVFCFDRNVAIGTFWSRATGRPQTRYGTRQDDEDCVGECWHDFSALYDSELMKCQIAIDIKKKNPDNPFSENDGVYKYLEYDLNKLQSFEKTIARCAGIAEEICAVHFIRRSY